MFSGCLRVLTLSLFTAAFAFSPLHAQTAAYVSNSDGGSVSVIDTASNTVTANIPVGQLPAGIAFSPDGATAYVADFADGAVTPVGLAAGTPRTPIKVPLGPRAIAITPDGKTAYVASWLVVPSLRSLPTAPPGMVTPICLPSSK